jgi:aminoglycoside phosphotransferase (APT) family kinase protein
LDLGDFGGKVDKGVYTERQISVWSNNYMKAVPPGDKVDEDMDQLMKWLPKNQPHGEQPLGKTENYC